MFYRLCKAFEKVLSGVGACLAAVLFQRLAKVRGVGLRVQGSRLVEGQSSNLCSSRSYRRILRKHHAGSMLIADGGTLAR